MTRKLENEKIKASIDAGEYEICRSEKALDSLAEFCWMNPEMTFAQALREWYPGYAEWNEDLNLDELISKKNNGKKATKSHRKS